MVGNGTKKTSTARGLEVKGRSLAFLAYLGPGVNGRWRPKEGEPVSQIHCHFCGGVIQDVATIDYRPPRASAQFAMPHQAPCTCAPPVVYEHPPVLGGTEEDLTP
jgi:hypothetical protein